MVEILEIEPDVVEKTTTEEDVKKQNLNHIILYNTNYHSYELVVMSLVMYCIKQWNKLWNWLSK